MDVHVWLCVYVCGCVWLCVYVCVPVTKVTLTLNSADNKK